MIREALRNAAYTVAPSYVVEKYLHRKMINEARRLRSLKASGDAQSALVNSLWRSHFFRPLQKQSEILRLLEIISTARPAAICEIGAAGCGTTFLLMQVVPDDATIITIDSAFTPSRQAALNIFASAHQRLLCLREDSHLRETVRIVADSLEDSALPPQAGCPHVDPGLDLLYLDGDHSYDGIKADFELYSPLVRPGGMIVFHDIVPDFKTRYGIETSSDVGGVPQFWNEIKAAYDQVEEIVEDYEQDGFGIGVVYWS